MYIRRKVFSISSSLGLEEQREFGAKLKAARRAAKNLDILERQIAIKAKGDSRNIEGMFDPKPQLFGKRLIEFNNKVGPEALSESAAQVNKAREWAKNKSPEMQKKVEAAIKNRENTMNEMTQFRNNKVNSPVFDYTMSFDHNLPNVNRVDWNGPLNPRAGNNYNSPEFKRRLQVADNMGKQYQGTKNWAKNKISFINK